MLEIALMLVAVFGSSVVMLSGLLIVGFRQGWFDFLSDDVPDGTNCTTYATNACADKQNTAAYAGCYTDAETRCTSKGGVIGGSQVGEYPLDCNAGARLACRGKGQECVGVYKKACVAQGGKWVRKDGTIEKICGRTDLAKKAGGSCPTTKPECDQIQECKFACDCGHGFAEIDDKAEWGVFLYAQTNGVQLVRKGYNLNPNNNEQPVIQEFLLNEPITVNSIRVGKNVSANLTSDDGSTLKVARYSSKHGSIINVADYEYTGKTTSIQVV